MFFFKESKLGYSSSQDKLPTGKKLNEQSKTIKLLNEISILKKSFKKINISEGQKKKFNNEYFTDLFKELKTGMFKFQSKPNAISIQDSIVLQSMIIELENLYKNLSFEFAHDSPASAFNYLKIKFVE